MNTGKKPEKVARNLQELNANIKKPLENDWKKVKIVGLTRKCRETIENWQKTDKKWRENESKLVEKKKKGNKNGGQCRKIDTNWMKQKPRTKSQPNKSRNKGRESQKRRRRRR